MGTPDPGTSELRIQRTLQKIIEEVLRKEERRLKARRKQSDAQGKDAYEGE
jgi:hypothetical protein